MRSILDFQNKNALAHPIHGNKRTPGLALHRSMGNRKDSSLTWAGGLQHSKITDDEDDIDVDLLGSIRWTKTGHKLIKLPMEFFVKIADNISHQDTGTCPYSNTADVKGKALGAASKQLKIQDFESVKRGAISKHLKIQDFELVKTLGTW